MARALFQMGRVELLGTEYTTLIDLDGLDDFIDRMNALGIDVVFYHRAVMELQYGNNYVSILVQGRWVPGRWVPRRAVEEAHAAVEMVRKKLPVGFPWRYFYPGEFTPVARNHDIWEHLLRHSIIMSMDPRYNSLAMRACMRAESLIRDEIGCALRQTPLVDNVAGIVISYVCIHLQLTELLRALLFCKGECSPAKKWRVICSATEASCSTGWYTGRDSIRAGCVSSSIT